tara:strand:+ start:994 stop:2277 length:1284 start_codon:yes stop_codon:yes gene_type:complete
MGGMTTRIHDNMCVLLHSKLEQERTAALMTAEDILAEPDERTASWGASVFRRLMVMSTGPLAVGMEPGPYLERLEAAGLLNINEEGDPLRARLACWPTIPLLRRLNAGCGSPRPSIVIVGDRSQNGEQLPFASAGGEWLFRALRKLGYDELSVYVVNARTPSGRRRTKLIKDLYKVFEAQNPIWLGVTQGAFQCLQTCKIPSIKASGPQRFMRKHRGNGPELYAEHLRKSGLPNGPHFGLDLPKVKVSVLPKLPMPYGIKTLACFRAFGHEKDVVKIPTMSEANMEKARRLFIMQSMSLKDVASEIGVGIKRLQAIAKAYDWNSEVREYQREVTDAIRQASIEKEVRDISKLRSLLWEGSVSEMEGVIEAQKSDNYRFTPNNAKALTQTAILLSEAGFLEREEDDETNGLTLFELAQKAMAAFKSEE